MNSHGSKPARRRLIEIVLGLFFVVLAIAATRVWVELKNTRRADSYALRQSVALTFKAADRYGLAEPTAGEVRRTWDDFLDTPLGQEVPADPAHEFLDSFMVRYQDGMLDSTEIDALYRQLSGFKPVVD